MISERDKRNIIVPGYAGDIDEEELTFIKDRLLQNRRLRARWGFKRGGIRLSVERIIAVAEHGVEVLQDSSREASTPDIQLRSKNETVESGVFGQLGLFENTATLEKGHN